MIVGGNTLWFKVPSKLSEPLPPLVRSRVADTVKVLLPLAVIVPPLPMMVPAKVPRVVQMNQVPPVIDVELPAVLGSGEIYFTAVQKLPTVGLLLTSPRKDPEKSADPQIDCGHSSIPERCPVSFGVEAANTCGATSRSVVNTAEERRCLILIYAPL
jgi:hypothetical protein